MRLIDADELLILETVAFNKAQAKTSDKITRLVNEVVHKKLQMLVSDAPTAYDMDKVVERLEEATKYARPVGWKTRQEIILTKRAIEIVEGGGKSEQV